MDTKNITPRQRRKTIYPAFLIGGVCFLFIRHAQMGSLGPQDYLLSVLGIIFCAGVFELMLRAMKKNT